MDLLLFSLAHAFTLGKREAISPFVLLFLPILGGKKAKTHDQRQPWSSGVNVWAEERDAEQNRDIKLP
jgi:hypothetical protein